MNGSLSVDQNLPDVVTLDVFDMFGIQQLSRTLDGRSGLVTHQVDMSSYLNGLYFFRFTSKDHVYTYSVIKE